jgi:hypothetical protein
MSKKILEVGILDSTWLTDEEYYMQKATVVEHDRIVAILRDLDRRYKEADPSSELAKHPFRAALRQINKTRLSI